MCGIGWISAENAEMLRLEKSLLGLASMSIMVDPVRSTIMWKCDVDMQRAQEIERINSVSSTRILPEGS